MYGYRGRTGPSKTPPNVQCQKCSLLTAAERHYSYECKAAPQERPYVARPSRTQQLFNPKLLPKLASETPNALQERQGVADEELAKREAERARKRAREAEEDDALRDSPSCGSVSSISTRSPSPAPKRSRTPERRERRRYSPSPSPQHRRGRQPSSYDSDNGYSPGPSERSEPGYRAPASRGSRSPSPRRRPSPRRERGGRDSGRHGSPGSHARGRDPHARRAYSPSRSRSPSRRDEEREAHGARRYRDREARSFQGRRSPSPLPPPRQPSPPRERSLSPFSKRLALTQAMNRGR
ncbi:hypothetical protein L209DRAFT_760655 [Thermothelomyces heterothallicus CBS 203.75]